ncbi:MAG TPA: alkaline phosphatase D family protein, partial [Polyangiaceae bacterium]|nr:alkaline phosphatase D family protein [Polyangiaceae bacterium]
VVAAGGAGAAGAAERPRASGFFPQSVASGDPRPGSVVLWTRVSDAQAGAGGSLSLELEVGLDEELAELVELAPGSTTLLLTADETHDHCVKVRVENLSAATFYYYRFTYVRGDERHVSRTGRTRTAPDPDADVAARFAVLSCQDYVGKYFHVLRHAARQELDFFVHLGDYVYETVDDPTFQDPTPARRVTFRNPEQAHPLGAQTRRLAANSFANYCDLYRTLRSDRDLQELHERFPMIAVWDDHEFSNDAYGFTSTYSNGRADEANPERRRNADRAWFSYMPVDYAEAPALALDESAAFPDDFRIYRSFVFGRHLELVMTDLRRFRPDHLVPEEAFPGAVFLDEPAAVELLGEAPDGARSYLDVDAFAGGSYGAALRAAAPELGFDASRVSGLVSARWVNAMLAQAGLGEPAPIDASDPALPRGFAYFDLLKNQEYTSLGARQLVAEAPFRALAAKRWSETGGSDRTSGTSELVHGAAQRAWFTETLLASTRTWKVWGNEYALMPRVVDLRAVTLAPEELRARILVNVDDWDGLPNERDALLRELYPVENLVVVSGDLHAFFAGTPHPTGDPSARVVEFVAGSVSSTPWLTSIERVAANEPELPPEAVTLARAVEVLLVDPDARPNPHIGWLDVRSNGYALVSAGGETLDVSVVTLHDSFLAERELSGSLESHFVTIEFRVRSGTRDLEQLRDGVFRRWDLETMRWV